MLEGARMSAFEYVESDVSFQNLRQVAFELEAEKSKRLRPLRPNSARVLESTLKNVALELQPSADDNHARIDILQRLANVVQRLPPCKGANVVPFGSFESNLYNPWGDLDVCLVLPESASKNKRITALRAIQRILIREGGASGIRVLAQPRIPLLMYEDSRWKISCDISVNNAAAIIKSRVLRFVTSIDSRCRDLIFLIKCWAKAQCINDPKMGTLNSYALSMLVIFHLQTRETPILPPLSEFITPGMLDAADDTALNQCLAKIITYTAERHGSRNASTVGELFVSFFTQFSSVGDLWLEGLAVCPFRGKWGDRNTTDRDWEKKRYVMMVEDPFDLSDNCARSVHESSLELICRAFNLTLETLQQDSFYAVSSRVRDVLFCWPVGQKMPRIRTSWYEAAAPGLQGLRDYAKSTADRLMPEFQKREVRVKRETRKQEAKVVREMSRAAARLETANVPAEIVVISQEKGTVEVVAAAAALSEGSEHNTGNEHNMVEVEAAEEDEEVRGEEKEVNLSSVGSEPKKLRSDDEVLYSIRRLFFCPSRRRRPHRYRRKKYCVRADATINSNV